MAASPECLPMSASISVDVQRASDDADIPDDQTIIECLKQALAHCGKPMPLATEVVVRIVNAGEIQALNRKFRQNDKPTNVLSFPADRPAGLPAGEALPLGDIVVCAEILRAEAASQGKPLADHWAHILVHGTLHLLGFDHANDADAAVMEVLEAKILALRGIADPYVG